MPRKQKKYHYLYKTTNLKNGKFYVGMHSTNDLDDEYLGSGKYIRRSIRRHGKENFKREILEFYSTREILIEQEMLLVNREFLKEVLCMNLRVGGLGAYPFQTFSEETKKKQSESRKRWISLSELNVPWNKGKIDVISEKTRKKISNSLLGNNNRKGKLASEETRNNISVAKKLCYQNGIKPPDTSTPIEQYDMNNTFVASYKSIREAAEQSGCSTTCIGRVLKGQRNHTKNFIWKYV